MILEFANADISDAQIIYEMAEKLILLYEDSKAVNIPKAIAWTKRKITEHITDYERILLNSETVGYFHWIDHITHWELDDFYILPQHRGKGIGTLALQTRLRFVDKPVILYVFTQNLPAVRLYEKLGFTLMTTVSDTRQILRRDA